MSEPTTDAGLRLSEDPPEDVKRRLFMMYGGIAYEDLDVDDAIEDLRALSRALVDRDTRMGCGTQGKGGETGVTQERANPCRAP